MGINKIGLVLRWLVFLCVNGLLLCMATPDVHYYDFVLKETNFTRLCSTKSMLTVNESFPGPEIRVHKGDTVYVNAINQGSYNITLHWHGIKQPRNPWYDGPEYVTQCPIKAGTNFTYKLLLSDEVGTLWWHAHSDWSRATVHGAIIILPAEGETYPFPAFDEERTLVIGSWFKGDVMEILEYSTATGATPNLTDGYTINGQLGDLYNCSKESTYRIAVDYGKTYLLRVVNAVMNDEMFFSIAQHNFTIYGSCGAYVKPVNTNYMMTTPGQTMDILFTANQSPSHYYIASRAYASNTGADFDETITTAIVEYNGNYTAPTIPYFPNDTLPYSNDTDAASNFVVRLKSLANEDYPIDVPQTIDRRIFITVSTNQLPCTSNTTCEGPNGNMQAASLNNISLSSPTIDFLLAYYSNKSGVFEPNFPDVPPRFFNFTGDSTGNTTIPTVATKASLLEWNQVVELVFQGTSVGGPENHPMHLHGFSFYVVGMGKGNYNNLTDPLNYNLVDPPFTNTIGLPKLGWVAVRFKADNPGVWFMHCHLEKHTTWGMANVFIVKDGNTTDTSIYDKPDYMPPC